MPDRPVRCPAVPGRLPHEQRLAIVNAAFESLPDRYLGAPTGFDATYHLRLGDLGHTWEVRATSHGVRVRRGATNRTPDVTIGTDSSTSVYAVPLAGQTARPAPRPGTVTEGVDAAPGALGSGPVVTVGLGADGRVLCGAVPPGAPCVPVPRGRLSARCCYATSATVRAGVVLFRVSSKQRANTSHGEASAWGPSPPTSPPPMPA